MPWMQATSSALPSGRMTSFTPLSLAEITMGSAPRTGLREPSRESSPSSRTSSRCSVGSWRVAARMHTAMGRSKEGPSFRVSAGARLTVSRAMGMANPLLAMAALTRSRLSLTEASGRPMISSAGRPLAA